MKGTRTNPDRLNSLLPSMKGTRTNPDRLNWFPTRFTAKQTKEEDESEEEIDSEDEASLYFAISEDDPVGLKRLLKEDLDPNTTFDGMNQLGKSLLHLSCEKGHKECVELLLAAGARVNKRDNWYQTPLMYASCTERLDMIELLVEAGADLDKGDMYGKTALHFTLDHETTDCMQVLLEGGACVNASDSLGRTPLWFAASEDGHVKAMECLLSYGARMDFKDIREKRTPIQAALAHSKKDTMSYLKMLVEARSPVNCVDEYGHTCIMTIMRKYKHENSEIDQEDIKYIQLLLDAGHDINLSCERWTAGAWYQFHGTALNMAIDKDLYPFAELLLRMGADPDNYEEKKSSSPLTMAAFNNRLDIAKLLLRANCKIGMRCRIVDGESSLNMTAFRCAITKEHWDFIELLIQAGYDLKEEDYLWSNTDIPTELILNLDMWTRLIDYVQTPLSLIFSCRNKIRNVLRRPLEPKIYSLPLPTYLKEFLLLKKL